MAFKKGQGGRPKGAKNRVTSDVGIFCRELVQSSGYRKYFEHRLLVGQLPPALEALTWHYAYGKPVERLEHAGPDGGAIVVTWKS